MSCPIDHTTGSQSQVRACPVDNDGHMNAAESDKCPVDHSARSAWTGLAAQQRASSSSTSSASPPTVSAALPTDREISSIPRADGERWVYPSQAQFFAAMARKRHEPRANDMQVVVPIHNAVNERAWAEVRAWEAGKGGEQCGGPRLVSFRGRPGDLSPRARWKTLLGYQAPFDRHDWVVDRCGTRIRYVIDFYTGKAVAGNLAFYMDVRPALDSWEGVKMRALRTLERWVGPLSLRTPQSMPAQAESTAQKH